MNFSAVFLMNTLRFTLNIICIMFNMFYSIYICCRKMSSCQLPIFLTLFGLFNLKKLIRSLPLLFCESPKNFFIQRFTSPYPIKHNKIQLKLQTVLSKIITLLFDITELDTIDFIVLNQVVTFVIFFEIIRSFKIQNTQNLFILIHFIIDI